MSNLTRYDMILGKESPQAPLERRLSGAGIRRGLRDGGAVQAAFNPLSLSPYAWFRGDAYTDDGSGNVLEATDLSGNGRHLSAASAGERPASITDAAFNNLRIFNFTVGKKLMSASNHTFGPYAVVFVASAWANTDAAFNLGNWDYSLLRFLNKFYTRRSTGSGNSGRISTANLDANRHVYAGSFGTTHATCVQYLDGNVNPTTDENTGNPGTATMAGKLCMSGTETGLAWANGIKIRQMWIFNRELTSTEITQLTTYANLEFA